MVFQNYRRQMVSVSIMTKSELSTVSLWENGKPRNLNTKIPVSTMTAPYMLNLELIHEFRFQIRSFSIIIMTIESRVNFRVSCLAWSVLYHPHPRPHQKLTVTIQQATVKHTRTKSKRGTKGNAEYVQFLNFRLWSVK